MQSDGHEHPIPTDMEWALLPALAISQFKVWREVGEPIGFAGWS